MVIDAFTTLYESIIISSSSFYSCWICTFFSFFVIEERKKLNTYIVKFLNEKKRKGKKGRKWLRRGKGKRITKENDLRFVTFSFIYLLAGKRILKRLSMSVSFSKFEPSYLPAWPQSTSGWFRNDYEHKIGVDSPSSSTILELISHSCGAFAIIARSDQQCRSTYVSVALNT